MSNALGAYFNACNVLDNVICLSMSEDQFEKAMKRLLSYHNRIGNVVIGSALRTFILPALLINLLFIEISFSEKTSYQEIYAQSLPAQDTSKEEFTNSAADIMIMEYPVPTGSRPHDVAPITSTPGDENASSRPALELPVWYTAQGSGELGKLDAVTGETRHIALGQGSAPHGVILGPDGAPWVTDGGLNAIVRVDPNTEEIKVYSIPVTAGYVNLNTATFDPNGLLWFTGQSGVYGRLDPQSGLIDIFEAPGGRGPYGISTTPNGTVYYSSLAGSFVARINLENGNSSVLLPPTADQGTRRVWPDSYGRVWVSEWNAGQLAAYDPLTEEWKEWKLPGKNPMPYAVYVDEKDLVWLSDFGSNALVRFDPTNETFDIFTLPSTEANVRQILGRAGEVWGAESGADKLVVVLTPAN